MTCRMMGCHNLTGGSKFCSTQCEVKFDHIREDARQARLAEAKELREDGRR